MPGAASAEGARAGASTALGGASGDEKPGEQRRSWRVKEVPGEEKGVRKGKRGSGARGLRRGREGEKRREEARRKVCGRSGPVRGGVCKLSVQGHCGK